MRQWHPSAFQMVLMWLGPAVQLAAGLCLAVMTWDRHRKDARLRERLQAILERDMAALNSTVADFNQSYAKRIARVEVATFGVSFEKGAPTAPPTPEVIQ